MLNLFSIIELKPVCSGLTMGLYVTLSVLVLYWLNWVVLN